MKIEMGIGWMPDGPNHVRSATPGEYAREILRLRSAITKTIEENRHLADGDNCTLRHLITALSGEGQP